jgi:hypothetical protein
LVDIPVSVSDRPGRPSAGPNKGSQTYTIRRLSRLDFQLRDAAGNERDAERRLRMIGARAFCPITKFDILRLWEGPPWTSFGCCLSLY